MLEIRLISYSDFSDEMLEEIRVVVERELEVPAKVIKSQFDITNFYDELRRQYDGNKILSEVVKYTTGSRARVIALFDVDIFIPILTFIFGQANFKGQTGIASSYRLQNELYGLERNDKLMMERFIKIIIHELGHSYGLKHCFVPGCVMRSSTYVENIDQKERRFCHGCKEELDKLK